MWVDQDKINCGVKGQHVLFSWRSTRSPGSQLSGKGGGGWKKGQPCCVGIDQGEIKESGLRGWPPVPNKPTVVSVDVKQLSQLKQ